nr:hypothetical protein [Escherichia coli]
MSSPPFTSKSSFLDAIRRHLLTVAADHITNHYPDGYAFFIDRCFGKSGRARFCLIHVPSPLSEKNNGKTQADHTRVSRSGFCRLKAGKKRLKRGK